MAGAHRKGPEQYISFVELFPDGVLDVKLSLGDIGLILRLLQDLDADDNPGAVDLYGRLYNLL